MRRIIRVGTEIDKGDYALSTVRSCELDNGLFIPVLKIILRWVCGDCFHGLLITEDDVYCPNCGGHKILRHNMVAEERSKDADIIDGLPEDLRATVLESTTISDAHADPLWSVGQDKTAGRSLWKPRALPSHLRKS